MILVYYTEVEDSASVDLSVTNFRQFPFLLRTEPSLDGAQGDLFLSNIYIVQETQTHTRQHALANIMVYSCGASPCYLGKLGPVNKTL